MHPVSRGTVHIQSADPLEKPSVDPAYLSSSVDLDIMVNAVKFTKVLHETSPLKDLTVGFVEPAWDDEAVTTDENLREYVRNGLEPIYHPVSLRIFLRFLVLLFKSLTILAFRRGPRQCFLGRMAALSTLS